MIGFLAQFIEGALGGGVITAPLVAFICKKLPKRLLGTLLGISVIILNLVKLLRK